MKSTVQQQNDKGVKCLIEEGLQVCNKQLFRVIVLRGVTCFSNSGRGSFWELRSPSTNQYLPENDVKIITTTIITDTTQTNINAIYRFYMTLYYINLWIVSSS